MKNNLIVFSFILLLSACTTQNPEQAKTENVQLQLTIDSLEIELERVQKEVKMQRAIAERQTEIALEQRKLAQQAAEIAKRQQEIAKRERLRARIAEDSAYAEMKRANDLKK